MPQRAARNGVYRRLRMESLGESRRNDLSLTKITIPRSGRTVSIRRVFRYVDFLFSPMEKRCSMQRIRSNSRRTIGNKKNMKATGKFCSCAKERGVGIAGKWLKVMEAWKTGQLLSVERNFDNGIIRYGTVINR